MDESSEDSIKKPLSTMKDQNNTSGRDSVAWPGVTSATKSFIKGKCELMVIREVEEVSIKLVSLLIIEREK